MQAIRCRIEAVTRLAEAIRSFRIVTADASPLPAWEPGAHIDVHLPSGRVRQYSLCGDLTRGAPYEIAVQLEPNGRGGSREVFDAVAPGDDILISLPRNNFPLAREAASHLFVAGGIGITPFIPMIRSLQHVATPFKLVYCSRSPERAAFIDFALELAASGLAIVHHDAGEPERRLDLHALLGQAAEGTHLYCCGPEGLMRAVREASAGWPGGTVHWEYFANTPLLEHAHVDNPFKVQLRSSGLVLDIPAEESIMGVLRANGVAVDSSCESGLCGTCKTRYLSGEPDHRDMILDESERREFVMICCSRSRTGTLLLDL